MAQNNSPGEHPQPVYQPAPPQYQAPPNYQAPQPPQYQQPLPAPPQQSAPVPPPQKKGMGCMKGIMLAVILFVALAVIGAMAAPKTNRGTTGTNGSSGTGGTVANPVAKIGDAVTVGSWNVTVEKIETSTGFDWSGFKNMQEPKGIYVFVYATATNNSTKTDSVNSFDYKIVDGTGATFDSCNELGCFGYPNKLDRDSFNTQVPPRTATKLLGIFDVAPHSKNLTLVIERNTKIAIGNTP